MERKPQFNKKNNNGTFRKNPNVYSESVGPPRGAGLQQNQAFFRRDYSQQENEEEQEQDNGREIEQKFTIHQAKQYQGGNGAYFMSSGAQGRGKQEGHSNLSKNTVGLSRGGSKQWTQFSTVRGRGRGVRSNNGMNHEQRAGFKSYPLNFEQTKGNSRRRPPNAQPPQDYDAYSNSGGEEEKVKSFGQGGNPDSIKQCGSQQSSKVQTAADYQQQLFEESVSQDASQMKFINDLSGEGYAKPDFFKGPVFKFFREQDKLNNRNKYIQDGAYDSISQYPQNKYTQGRKPQYNNGHHQYSKGASSNNNQRFYYQRIHPNQDKDFDEDEEEDDDYYEEEKNQQNGFQRKQGLGRGASNKFDLKYEKKAGNKFWKGDSAYRHKNDQVYVRKRGDGDSDQFEQNEGEKRDQWRSKNVSSSSYHHGYSQHAQGGRGNFQGGNSRGGGNLSRGGHKINYSVNNKTNGDGLRSGGQDRDRFNRGDAGHVQKKGGKQDYHNKSRMPQNHFDDFIEDEKKIEIGIEKGYYFEGVMRINQNNRRRAFVNVSGLKMDVMIDGMQQQNRALDGDTVIIELLPPTRWTENISNNVVVNGGKTKSAYDLTRGNDGFARNKDTLAGGEKESESTQDKMFKGYTNETAIEKRVVDSEFSDKDGLTSGCEDDQEKELRAMQKDYCRQSLKEEEKKVLSPEEEDEQDLEDENCYIDEEGSSSSGVVAKCSSKSKEENKQKAVPQGQVEKEERKEGFRLLQLKGINREERLKEINSVGASIRPLARVRAIRASPNRDKELLVTLMPLEKDLLNIESIEKLQSQMGKKQNNNGICAVPISKKLPWMSLQGIPAEFIEDVKNKKKPQQRYYIAKIVDWKVSSMRPACEIIRCIGEAGNLDAESLRILKSLDIYSDEYDAGQQNVVNEKLDESLRVFTKDLSKETGEWTIPEEEIKKRVDLRKRRIFTIDPLTAKDLDDALSIEKISGTIYEIGVHIADVSYFVQQGTELDKEAQLRCTSVYFVHKVYPMLPRLLCERLCSLNPSVDRLSYSVFFRMDIRNGELIDYKHVTPNENSQLAYEQSESQKPASSSIRIERTVMRSCAKWNYQLVQDILDGKITNESMLPEAMRPEGGHSFADMRQDCFLMNEIAQKRRKKRLDNGSLVLQNREFMFLLDQESKHPLSFQESYRIESKFLVEEYMLLANILIAEHLYKFCWDKTLLRVHPDLDEDKKGALSEFYEKVGLGGGIMDLTNSKTLSISMEKLRESCIEEKKEGENNMAKLNVAVRKFLTCLQQAKYICINENTPDQCLHYGLNFPLYTHFTSPIRRYADLLVHRLVTLTLQHKELTRDLIEQMDYSNYAELCSEKSQNAKKASTQCTRLFHCLLLKSEGKRVFETLLFDVEQGAIQIYIDEVNMHHKIKLRDDPRIDSLVYFEDDMTIVAHIKECDSSLDSLQLDQPDCSSSLPGKDQDDQVIRGPNSKKKGANNDSKKGNLQLEKDVKVSKGVEKHVSQKDQLEKFKKVTSINQFKEQFKEGEFILFRIFDKVKVLVDTTTEFPLDIKCALLFTKDDLHLYDKMKQEEKVRIEDQSLLNTQKLAEGSTVVDMNNDEV